MLETGVQVRLLSQLDHFGEVLVIYMGVHSEQALQYCLRYRIEMARKRYACGCGQQTTRESIHNYLPVRERPGYTYFRGEQCLVV